MFDKLDEKITLYLFLVIEISPKTVPKALEWGSLIDLIEKPFQLDHENEKKRSFDLSLTERSRQQLNGQDTGLVQANLGKILRIILIYHMEAPMLCHER